MDNYEAAWKALNIVAWNTEFEVPCDKRHAIKIIESIEMSFGVGELGCLFKVVDDNKSKKKKDGKPFDYDSLYSLLIQEKVKTNPEMSIGEAMKQINEVIASEMKKDEAMNKI